jgi:hypothetical protein
MVFQTAATPTGSYKSWQDMDGDGRVLLQRRTPAGLAKNSTFLRRFSLSAYDQAAFRIVLLCGPDANALRFDAQSVGARRDHEEDAAMRRVERYVLAWAANEQEITNHWLDLRLAIASLDEVTVSTWPRVLTRIRREKGVELVDPSIAHSPRMRHLIVTGEVTAPSGDRTAQSSFSDETVAALQRQRRQDPAPQRENTVAQVQPNPQRNLAAAQQPARPDPVLAAVVAVLGLGFMYLLPTLTLLTAAVIGICGLQNARDWPIAVPLVAFGLLLAYVVLNFFWELCLLAAIAALAVFVHRSRRPPQPETPWRRLVAFFKRRR